jgi:hypothetical protein
MSIRHRRAGICSLVLRSAGMLLVLVICGCGGGASSSIASNTPPASAGTPFQPRSFPGDFFVRLSPQIENGYAAEEVYDPALKEVFVSNPGNNAVEVFSTIDAHMVGEISVPGPSGLSFSPDYSTLVVGTITPYFYLADPLALHVTQQIEVPAAYLTNGPSMSTVMPVNPYAMADGSIMIGMGVVGTATNLIRYDRARGTFASQDPDSRGIRSFPARSGDGKSLIVTGVGQLLLYTAAAQAYVASSGVPSNFGAALAANADGSQFAAVLQINAPGMFSTQVNFWGPNLQGQGQYTNPAYPVGGGVFSRDGKYLYIILATNRIVALNTQTAAPAGYLGAVVGASSVYSQLFDIDENSHLFGAPLFGGMFIVNASQLASSSPAALPDFATPGSEGSANIGPLAGGGNDTFNVTPTGPGSTNTDSSMEAYFGGTPSPNDLVTGTSLTSVIPPGMAPGPVSVVLTDANNDVVFLPDAFTYGPHLLRVTPNAISPDGGDRITFVGYGLAPYNGSNPVSYSYPEAAVSVAVSAGAPGWVKLTLSNSYGSDSMSRGFQYLKTEAVVKGPPFTSALYDPVRDLFYLTGSGNTVGVFDPRSKAFLTPLQSTAVSSSATFVAETLTPDSSKLLVSDPSDHSVIVFDLNSGNSAAVNILLSSDPSIPLSDPMPVVAAASNRAFVSITPCISNPVREINLADLTVHARSDAASVCTTYLLYPEYGRGSADGHTIVFAENAGQVYGFEPSGPEYVWRYDTPSDSFTGPVQIGDQPWIEGLASLSDDGQVIALTQGTLDQRLLPLVPLQAGGVDSRLNHTGSLLYAVEGAYPVAANLVSISDTHNGRLLLTMGLQANIGGSRGPLAIDPTGDKVLVATPTGVSYFELGVIPLAVGTVSPSQGLAGTSIKIRGSGFVSSTTVQIGGQNAICTETDSETLFCTVPNLRSGQTYMTLANPDGQTYTLESAFTVQ